MPVSAEDKGVISGPIPIGENHENTTETIAATLNGVNTFENTFAATVPALKRHFHHL